MGGDSLCAVELHPHLDPTMKRSLFGKEGYRRNEPRSCHGSMDKNAIFWYCTKSGGELSGKKVKS